VRGEVKTGEMRALGDETSWCSSVWGDWPKMKGVPKDRLEGSNEEDMFKSTTRTIEEKSGATVRKPQGTWLFRKQLSRSLISAD